MSVAAALFRFYRPIILGIAGIFLITEIVAVPVAGRHGGLEFSPWLLALGNASKYWLLVVGTMLVAMHLKQFVANGVTRHEYIAGAAVFLLLMSAGFTAAIILGHAVESLVVTHNGWPGQSYPEVSYAAEAGQALPTCLAYATSGALIAIGYYRFPPWIGVLVMIPAAIPLGLAEGLFGLDDFGGPTRLVPYAPALLLVLAATALAGFAFFRAARDVAIRRTPG
jgi:hypothetical protein